MTMLRQKVVDAVDASVSAGGVLHWNRPRVGDITAGLRRVCSGTVSPVNWGSGDLLAGGQENSSSKGLLVILG